MVFRARGVLRVFRQLPGRDQRGHLNGEAHQRFPMVVEVGGIRHPVALDVRTIRVRRVRPPVIAFRKEIVEPARAARRVRRRDSDRSFFDVPIRGREDARALALEIDRRVRGVSGGNRERADRGE